MPFIKVAVAYCRQTNSLSCGGKWGLYSVEYRAYSAAYTHLFELAQEQHRLLGKVGECQLKGHQQNIHDVMVSAIPKGVALITDQLDAAAHIAEVKVVHSLGK